MGGRFRRAMGGRSGRRGHGRTYGWVLLMFDRKQHSVKWPKKKSSANPGVLSYSVVVQSLSRVQFFFAIPWTAAHQATLPFGISWSLLRFTSTEWVSDAIWPSHPLTPYTFAFSLSQLLSEILNYDLQFSLRPEDVCNLVFKADPDRFRGGRYAGVESEAEECEKPSCLSLIHG